MNEEWKESAIVVTGPFVWSGRGAQRFGNETKWNGRFYAVFLDTWAVVLWLQ